MEVVVVASGSSPSAYIRGLIRRIDRGDPNALQLYSESRSATKALRTMRRRYPNDAEIRRLSARQVYRLVARFKETGSGADKRHDNVGRPRSSRSFENVQEVKHIIDETPEKSVCQVVSDLTNVTNYSSVYLMLRFDMK